MKERIKFWQGKREIKMTKKQYNLISKNLERWLNTMTEHGYLLKDIDQSDLSNKYLFDILDMLWSSVDNLKS